MRYLLTLGMLFIAFIASADDVVWFDTDTGYVTNYQRSINAEKTIEPGNDYVVVSSDNASNVKALRTLIKSVISIYLIHDNGVIREMTQQEKAVRDQEFADVMIANYRTDAKQKMNAIGGDGIFLRAMLEVLIEQINILRSAHSYTLDPIDLEGVISRIKTIIDSRDVNVR